MSRRVIVEPASAFVRHPVTMGIIQAGDEVEYSPAIARLIKSGNLKIIESEKPKRASAKSSEE